MRIIIAGGGIGGIAGALALRRAGVTPLVLEQAPALTQVGAGVNISANGMKALVHLGADRHVRGTSVRSEGSVFTDLETGAAIGRLALGSAGEEAWGESFYHVHRADLLHALLQQLPDGHLQLDSTVESVKGAGDGVVVRLTSGAELEADALISADGLKSVVRTALYGADHPRSTGYVAWRSLIPAGRLPAEASAPIGRVFLGPRRHVITYPVSGGQVVNFVGFVPDAEVASRESWTASGDLAALRASFAGGSELLASMVSAIDEAFITGIYFRDPLPEWGTGRIVLLGDAAHPVPPSAAQGACMALEDAVVLGRAVERYAHTDGVERAFAAYAAHRRPRTARLFGTAMNNFRMFSQSDPLEIHGRNGRMRGLARLDPVSDATWGWLYAHDPATALDDPATTAGLAGASTRNQLRRPAARRAFERWRGALRPTDFATGEPGLRAGFDRFLREVAPADAAAVPIDDGRIAGLVVPAAGPAPTTPAATGGPAVLHLHGGLFTMGSAAASVGYGRRLAEAVGGWAVLPEYRLAPEHEFPAALDDALAAYEWLLARQRGPVVVSGLDAGAGLAVGLALTARAAGLPQPAGLFLVSPLCDLSLGSPSIDAATTVDPWISRQFLALQAAAYLHGHDPADPRISPVRADLRGLPPMVVHAAAQEALADDARRLVAAARAAGVDATLVLADDSVHDFTLFPELPETAAALDRLSRLGTP